MDLIERDLRHIWHPLSQMKDYEAFKPLVLKSASGSYIELENGSQIIDAISSWWCKSLGHGHPRIKAALHKQIEKFEHVIGANTCSPILVELSEKLARLAPNLDKVFYASDGASAVEIALKMSLHARYLTGEKQRSYFLSLQNAYHGETCLALAVSDIGIYRDAYQHVLPQTFSLKNIPYVHSTKDPLWNNCEAVWPEIEKQLNRYAHKLTAIIFEPIMQAAAGMLIYSQDFLRRLCDWARLRDIHLIADEIMTGLGRTGFALACEHAAVLPDFVCLGKSLTAGWLPLSAVLTKTEIYDLFYADYEMQKSFLHSHTYSGNALAAAVALEGLHILEEENIYQRVRENESTLLNFMLDVAEQTQRLCNVRSLGAVVAADLVLDEWQKNSRYGYQVFQQATKLGALLRPVGNTIYWAPPLNIDIETLERLRDITIAAINMTFKNVP